MVYLGPAPKMVVYQIRVEAVRSYIVEVCAASFEDAERQALNVVEDDVSIEQHLDKGVLRVVDFEKTVTAISRRR